MPVTATYYSEFVKDLIPRIKTYPWGDGRVVGQSPPQHAFLGEMAGVDTDNPEFSELYPDHMCWLTLKIQGGNSTSLVICLAFSTQRYDWASFSVEAILKMLNDRFDFLPKRFSFRNKSDSYTSGDMLEDFKNCLARLSTALRKFMHLNKEDVKAVNDHLLNAFHCFLTNYDTGNPGDARERLKVFPEVPDTDFYALVRSQATFGDDPAKVKVKNYTCSVPELQRAVDLDAFYDLAVAVRYSSEPSDILGALQRGADPTYYYLDANLLYHLVERFRETLHLGYQGDDFSPNLYKDTLKLPAGYQKVAKWIENDAAKIFLMLKYLLHYGLSPLQVVDARSYSMPFEVLERNGYDCMLNLLKEVVESKDSPLAGVRVKLACEMLRIIGFRASEIPINAIDINYTRRPGEASTKGIDRYVAAAASYHATESRKKALKHTLLRSEILGNSFCQRFEERRGARVRVDSTLARNLTKREIAACFAVYDVNLKDSLHTDKSRKFRSFHELYRDNGSEFPVLADLVLNEEGELQGYLFTRIVMRKSSDSDEPTIMVYFSIAMKQAGFPFSMPALSQMRWRSIDEAFKGKGKVVVVMEVATPDGFVGNSIYQRGWPELQTEEHKALCPMIRSTLYSDDDLFESEGGILYEREELQVTGARSSGEKKKRAQVVYEKAPVSLQQFLVDPSIQETKVATFNFSPATLARTVYKQFSRAGYSMIVFFLAANNRARVDSGLSEQFSAPEGIASLLAPFIQQVKGLALSTSIAAFRVNMIHNHLAPAKIMPILLLISRAEKLSPQEKLRVLDYLCGGQDARIKVSRSVLEQCFFSGGQREAADASPKAKL